MSSWPRDHPSCEAHQECVCMGGS